MYVIVQEGFMSPFHNTCVLVSLLGFIARPVPIERLTMAILSAIMWHYEAPDYQQTQIQSRVDAPHI